MTIILSLSAPEHSHLIVNYHELFPEHNSFPLEWGCDTVPRIGESLDFSFIKDLVSGQVDTALLPKIWQIMDVKWIRDITGVSPVLYVVGK